MPNKPKTPNRSLGRVPDDEWATYQTAAKLAGKPFSQWARLAMMRLAFQTVLQPTPTEPQSACHTGSNNTAQGQG